MPKTKTASSVTAKSKTHRSARSTAKRPAASEPTPLVTFDAAAHYEEIAQTAYYIWLGRNGQAGSREEDWVQAEIQVRTRYTN